MREGERAHVSLESFKDHPVLAGFSSDQKLEVPSDSGEGLRMDVGQIYIAKV